MPSDLLAYMTDQDLVDIVEYLATLQTPTLRMDSWHIIGPFVNLSGDAGLEKLYPPEKTLDLAASYQGKSGKVAWRTVKPNAEGYVDLKAFFGADSDQTVSYLYRELESPADQEATVLLGTDDGAKLWVNGELVHTNKQHRTAAPEQESFKTRLKKGRNTILLKVNNADGPHGFYFTLVSDQELKLLSSQ
jgi:hypothetical protein